MTAKAWNIRLFAFLLAVWLFAGCERATHVSVEGGMTPVFVFSGNGKLMRFVVYSPDFVAKAESPFDENFALWEIKPNGGDSNGTPVGSLNRITYGVLPDGYRQVKPKLGPAPALMEGQRYFYDVETTNAAGAAGFLEIRSSRAVPTDGPHVCFGRKDNEWIRVPCAK